MKIWDDVHHEFRESTRTWVDWVRRGARELGDSGLRQIERRDLQAERRRSEEKLGAIVAERFITDGKKTLRRDAPGLIELLQRIRAIDERLEALEEDQKSVDQGPEASRGSGLPAIEALQEFQRDDSKKEKEFRESDPKGVDAE
ncbi:hypothetical protein AU468_02115 [Alkalispirochaeta sphaeroplastigenens]|uniref:Uncharacterized protein n=1 Tax=Alkalispirochaeta sphaeroplastigenens TaxID=1187066 RepID=A0A2S4K070_9SPIO|nr:hypothetical protein [Alkalispirochaeta sphaeroplastigenens]POR05164.1 hypothetical protein AU468_02115 [Alkalispirochaeta sphaeroplastigenens]